MARIDLIFNTERFNLTQSHPEWINPCCFGEDVVDWLGEELKKCGGQITSTNSEDFGWYFEATYKELSYSIAVTGNVNDEDGKSNFGEWRLMADRIRSFWERILGRNQLVEDDAFIALLRSILEQQPDFSGVRTE